jgi:tetratricopeptide (TPR) repeat protein
MENENKCSGHNTSQCKNGSFTNNKFKEPHDPDMLEINECLERLEFEKASQLLQNKLEKEPNNVNCIDTLSEVMMSLDDTEATIKLIKKSISLEPDNNGEKYMTLGQILSDYRQTLKMYQKGVAIFLEELKQEQIKNPNSSKNISLQNSISSAYASIAELYMNTDLW